MKLSPGPLLQSLIRTILVPLLCGAAARAAIPGEQETKRESTIHSDIVQGVAYCKVRLACACWPPPVLHYLIDALVNCDFEACCGQCPSR